MRLERRLFILGIKEIAQALTNCGAIGIDLLLGLAVFSGCTDLGGAAGIPDAETDPLILGVNIKNFNLDLLPDT